MPNRLATASSPYLLQHAHNPVDWYPWGPEALERAQQEEKVIFLSVGYATCHWCHVMERECFEDPQIAQYLNTHFIAIKVDREERPDVDQVYMTALQALSGSGGWPMNLFLLPNRQPFFGGTYFPPQDRAGQPSFGRVLAAVQSAWTQQRQEVEENAQQLTQHLNRLLEPRPGQPDPDRLEAFQQAFDPVRGGFGGAPKFPQSPALQHLLLQAYRGHQAAWKMLEPTLDAMAAGGIHDQIGGGFHRYATDAQWQIPHFEKMLYDNAQLARIYLGAYQVGKKSGYLRVARETIGWVLQEMTHEGGGFYAAQDADSEGEEGRFYLWSHQEVARVVTDRTEAACRLFGVLPGGNWEGQNILMGGYSEERLAEELHLEQADFEGWRLQVRQQLYQHRLRRPPPLTDDKILTDWNGLMLRTLAEAARLLQNQEYLNAALKNAHFFRDSVWDGQLLRHSWRQGQRQEQAFLADQAMYGLGLLELYQTTQNPDWLIWASQLAEGIMANFADPQGGFFDSIEDELPIRSRDSYDGALPCGNGSAAEFLIRLGTILERPDWRDAGLGAVNFYGATLERHPLGLPSLLQALTVAQLDSTLVLPDQQPSGWQDWYLPLTSVVSWGPLIEHRLPGMAYLCQHGRCQLPTPNPTEVYQQLMDLLKARRL